MKNEIVISPFLLLNESGFERAWKAIQEFSPTCIAGYPSAIYMLAQIVERKKLNHHFELVYYYAENCSDEVRAYIHDVFKCKVIGYYGHTERAVFAEEYKDQGGYRFNKLYGYTEYIPTEVDGEYQIVCTGFISRKMPLIRYVTDDVVTINENGFAQIMGHKFSEVCLISKSGARIFKGAMTMHSESFKKVKQYQFVQDEPGKAFLDIVPSEKIEDEDMGAISKYLSDRCEGELDVTVRVVDQIQLTSRGKYNWAVVNVGKSTNS
ncbi:MAG: hypothetical protein LUF29_08780 [Oscillospiraceae bacterium]|nr:hypothetical protein [Oscillospiraceae bacterium]